MASQTSTGAGVALPPLAQTLWQAVRSSHWQRLPLPPPSSVERNQCQRLYADDGHDIALARLTGNRTFALTAICPHAAGPLDQGDIEDLGNHQLLYCPVHMYGFDLATGHSSTGLQAEVFPVKCVEDAIFVNTPSRLALKSSAWFPRSSKAGGSEGKGAESKLLQDIQELLQIRTVKDKIGKLPNLLAALEKPDVIRALSGSKFFAVSPVVRGKLKDFRRKTEAIRQLTVTAMELMQLVDRLLVTLAMLGAMAGRVPSLDTTVEWLARALTDLLEWLREIYRIVEILPANLDELFFPPPKVVELEAEPEGVSSHFLTTLAVSLAISLARELEFLADRAPLIVEGGEDAKAVVERVQGGLQAVLANTLSTVATVSQQAGVAQDPASALRVVLTSYNKDYMELPFSVEEDKAKDSTSWYQNLTKGTGAS